LWFYSITEKTFCIERAGEGEGEVSRELREIEREYDKKFSFKGIVSREACIN
jgi:hypothetical protein